MSIMREYLTSDDEFYWPNNTKHLEVELHEEVPLTAVAHKCDSGNTIWKGETTMVRSYKAREPSNFKRLFAVKTFIDENISNSRTQAQKEIESMTALFHPHVAALLASYMQDERFHILVFPLGCCNLREFMNYISEKLDEKRKATAHETQRYLQPPQSRKLRSHSESEISNLGGTSTRGELESQITRDSWKTRSIDEFVLRLKSFFFCLCMALKYIHSQDVRHKDIKPQNVLIDGSLSPILADFGISARFPPGESHITHNGPLGTREYAAPEMIDAKHKRDHDDPADVFSLGCVFLEMATVLLGRTLSDFIDHRTPKEGGFIGDSSYNLNLPRLRTWIKALKEQNESTTEIVSGPGSTKAMVEALGTIDEMLAKHPIKRPGSDLLYSEFKDVSSTICPDCNGGSPWGPSPRQKRAQEERRSHLNKMPTLEEQQSQETDIPSVDPPRVAISLSQEPQEVTAFPPERTSALLPIREPVPSGSLAPSVVSSLDDRSIRLQDRIPTANQPNVKPTDNVFIHNIDFGYTTTVKFQEIQGSRYDVYKLPPKCTNFIIPGPDPTNAEVERVIQIPKRIQARRFGLRSYKYVYIIRGR